MVHSGVPHGPAGRSPAVPRTGARCSMGALLEGRRGYLRRFQGETGTHLPCDLCNGRRGPDRYQKVSVPGVGAEQR